MKWIQRTIRLLYEHNMFILTVVLVFCWVLNVIRLVNAPSESAVLYVLLVGFCIFWSTRDVYKEDTIFTLKKELAEAKDKACIAEHYTEQMRVELESYKAKQGKDDGIELEAEQKPLSKRRSSPKRKPKIENNEVKD